jgi:hypothetical protein
MRTRNVDGFAQPTYTNGTASTTIGTQPVPSSGRNRMGSRTHIVAFNGIDVLDIDCQA